MIRQMSKWIERKQPLGRKTVRLFHQSSNTQRATEQPKSWVECEERSKKGCGDDETHAHALTGSRCAKNSTAHRFPSYSMPSCCLSLPLPFSFFLSFFLSFCFSLFSHGCKSCMPHSYRITSSVQPTFSVTLAH